MHYDNTIMSLVTLYQIQDSRTRIENQSIDQTIVNGLCVCLSTLSDQLYFNYFIIYQKIVVAVTVKQKSVVTELNGNLQLVKDYIALPLLQEYRSPTSTTFWVYIYIYIYPRVVINVNLFVLPPRSIHLISKTCNYN